LNLLKSFIVAALLSAALPALAEGEKLSFKGVELGSGLAQIASNPKFDCRVVTTPIADQVCSLRPFEKETIVGAPVDSLFYFYDQSGLTGMVINFPEAHFPSVVIGLTEKFGQPSMKATAIKNLKGTAFENRTYRWTRPEGSLQAERYSGRLDKSTIRFVDDHAAQRVQQRRALLAKDPRKDL